MGSSKASSPLKVKDKKKKVNKGKEGDNRHRYDNSISYEKGPFFCITFDPDPLDPRASWIRIQQKKLLFLKPASELLNKERLSTNFYLYKVYQVRHKNKRKETLF